MRIVQLTVLIVSLCIGNAASAEQQLEIKKGVSVFGSSELPKGLTIVPWQAQAPDVTVEKLRFTVVDEIFQPIDRDVLRRQLGYYREIFPAPLQSR